MTGVFVTSFQLAGVQGTVVESPEKAVPEITILMNYLSVGLILVSDYISKTISNKLTELRSKNLHHPSLSCLHREARREKWTIEFY